jgi:hypothetical protein
MQIDEPNQSSGKRIENIYGNNMRNQFGEDSKPVTNFNFNNQNNQINNPLGTNTINLNPNIVINPQEIQRPNQNINMNNNNLNNNPFGQPFEPEVIISIYL